MYDPFGFKLTPEEYAEYATWLADVDSRDNIDSQEREDWATIEEAEMLEELRQRGVCPF